MNENRSNLLVSTMQTLTFYLGIALLLTHEMDAVRHSEWRLLFFLRDLSDADAYPIFLLLHVPIIVLLYWLGQHPKPYVQAFFRSGVSVFLILHACIHYYVSAAPHYLFQGIISSGLIYGAGMTGALYLFLAAKSNNRQ